MENRNLEFPEVMKSKISSFPRLNDDVPASSSMLLLVVYITFLALGVVIAIMNPNGGSVPFSSKNGDFIASDPEIVEKDPTGRYLRYNEVLGKGAFKIVYKAFDEVEGIEVAWNRVKIDQVLRSPEDLETLYSEVHLLRSVKHENIMKFFSSWVDYEKRTINMITELFTSGSLRMYREKHKHVDMKAIKNWSRQILKGLIYLHGHDPPIIHRDLKCDNVFVNGNNGEVKIGDLGLALQLQQPTTQNVNGTLEFMAPELYMDQYNELVDIYSFGMCILEMVTCEYPYSECDTPIQIIKKVTSGIKPASLSTITDENLKEFIEKCLAPASVRLSSKELLKDPFLQLERPKEEIRDPFQLLLCQSFKTVNVPMEIDSETKENSGTKSNLGHMPHAAVLECHETHEDKEFSLQGSLIDENTIQMSLRMAQLNGPVKNIHFMFYIDSDTAISVVNEMVEFEYMELELSDSDLAFIAKFIDHYMIRFLPSWKPSSDYSKAGWPCSENSPRSTVATFNTVDEGISGLFVSEHELGDYVEDKLVNGNNSGVVSNVISSASSCSSLIDKDMDMELQKELEATDAQYQQWFRSLEKMREEALEATKRRWKDKKSADH
ncbi:hypothetical protein ACFE04_026393 [Oxalis oulophora]